jgi:pyruvate dehydrogenase E1 component alpha subunit
MLQFHAAQLVLIRLNRKAMYICALFHLLSLVASMPRTKISKEIYLRWYEQMQLIRRFEEKCAQLYGQQKIKGFCHLYIGQEAVVAGTYSVIRSDDSVITAYRDHGHALACGLSPGSVMAELYGKITGCSKGKGGSMHMFSKQFKNFGGHGIVGGQIPLGAGIAFAEQYKGTDAVNVCYMGDGAVRQGALHETFNMAMLWKLPVVFVVENNYYAMGTSLERTTNLFDGMSCEAVHEAMQEAVDRARKGDGPTFLEIRTYRYRGHSMSDPAKYRTKEEVEDYRSRDPIAEVRATILSKKFAKESDLDAIDAAIEASVAEAVEFAEQSPWPEVHELYTDVYQQSDYPFITN